MVNVENSVIVCNSFFPSSLQSKTTNYNYKVQSTKTGAWKSGQSDVGQFPWLVRATKNQQREQKRDKPQAQIQRLWLCPLGRNYLESNDQFKAKQPWKNRFWDGWKSKELTGKGPRVSLLASYDGRFDWLGDGPFERVFVLRGSSYQQCQMHLKPGHN